jgi:hypothetical protein
MQWKITNALDKLKGTPMFFPVRSFVFTSKLLEMGLPNSGLA